MHAGAGAYICGEETALLDSLEGRRGQPRLRPPFPAVAGLYASPTVINNVESIASVPSIIDRGAEWFASMGTEKSKGYGIFSLSGHVTNPGQFEAPLGITLRELIDLAGGMRDGHELKFWTPGGSSTPLLTAEHLDVPLDFEGVAEVKLDARHPRPADLRRDHLRGPGGAALDRVLQARVLRQVHALPRGHLVAGPDAGQPRAGQGIRGRPRDPARHVCDNILGRSFCALGDGATSPITSSIEYFRDEYLAHLDARRLSVRPRGVGDLREGGCERMTTTPEKSKETAPEKSDEVTLTIDGVEVSVPKNTLVIRAAEQIGVQIPRFCDHPLLAPVGACRQCLVDIPDAGNGRGMPKPQASCTLTVAEGMVVNTQATSPVADKAQQGQMEFLLINHPLDCPVCDKGGECPLQNQAMSNGRGETRFTEHKRLYPKPINISAQVLLDRERCVLCARCTRFSEQIAGDPFIALIERGALQQVGIYEKEPFESYFSGNTIQICPVGALTSSAYRFRSRPFDLVSTPSIAEHDACGSAIRVDHRRGKVMRRLAGDDPEVNEEWITDKDRFAFHYASQRGPADLPDGARRRRRGELRPASWPEAFVVAARGLAAAREAGGVGVLTGGRLTAEDSYAYSKFARVALGTNDIDFRARAHSAEEADFLAAQVVLERPGSRRGDVRRPRDRPVGGARRSRARGRGRHGLPAAAQGRPRTAAADLLDRAVHLPRPAQDVRHPDPDRVPATSPPRSRRSPTTATVALDSGGLILVGERMAAVPGALAAVAKLAATTGARIAWIPRRAGDRGAVETGALPNLLPGGRPVADAAARVDLAAAWGVDHLPEAVGRDGDAIVAAAAEGELGGLVVGGVDPGDLADPVLAREAIETAGFVVALEVRDSEVTRAADVVFPVAPVTDRAGTFVNWEGRVRRVRQGPAQPVVAARPAGAGRHRRGAGTGLPRGSASAPPSRPGPRWPGRSLGRRAGGRPGRDRRWSSNERLSTSPGSLALASWKQLIDDGRMQDGDEAMRQTARKPVLLVGRATLEALGAAVGERHADRPLGSVALPIGVADLADEEFDRVLQGAIPVAGREHCVAHQDRGSRRVAVAGRFGRSYKTGRRK